MRALAARTTGSVFDPGDTPGYDEQRGGFNLALDHRPALVLAAATPSDVVEGIRFAAERGLPVDLQATGHGAHHPMTGGLLITTRRLTEVVVDPQSRTARVPAGATAADVLAATAAHGLTAPVGSAPGVGYVSLSLGGGLGPLGRRYGFAADHVRQLDIVTADGRDLTVTPDHPELFWALRGGGGNLAAVTGLEIGLLPVHELYGGGLFFPGERAADVIEQFHACIETATPDLTLSVAFVTFPGVEAVPPPLRGRSCCHVRVAYLGDPATGRRLIEPLVVLSPFLDTVDMLPMTSIGTIHADPVGPMPVHTDSAALLTEDVLDQMPSLIDPHAPFLLEIRHLGGALADPPEIPNAVGHRMARLNLFTSAYPGTDLAAVAAAEQRVYDAIRPAGAGGPLRTFLPTSYPDASSCYEPATADQLAGLKQTWDPGDMFRFAPSVAATSAPVPSY